MPSFSPRKSVIEGGEATKPIALLEGVRQGGSKTLLAAVAVVRR